MVDASWLDCIQAAAEGCAEEGHVEAARVLLPLIEPFAERLTQGATGGMSGGSMSRHCGLLAQCLGRWDDADAYIGDVEARGGPGAHHL